MKPAPTPHACSFSCLIILFILILFRPVHAAPGDEHWDFRFRGPGTTNLILALAWKDGRLYTGGAYDPPPQVTNRHLEVWDGTNWSGLPDLHSGFIIVFDLVWFGNELYVGGLFNGAGGVSAPGLARWNGTSWSDVGGFQGVVRTLLVHGGNLYVGGSFTNIGGVATTNIGCWNGSSWSALGPGLGSYDVNGNTGVEALAVYAGQLHAGGVFTNAGGTNVQNLARWDGANWVSVGGGANQEVAALAADANNLYAGGRFSSAGGVAAQFVAAWNGSAWSALGSGMSSQVYTLALSGGQLYAGGQFTQAGGISARGIARWDGTNWSPLAGGLSDAVYRILPQGTNLYVGGFFETADGLTVNHVARWDGTAWSALGSELGGGFASQFIYTVAASGPTNVYAGGFFSAAGSVRANRVARFDGTRWSAMGSGLSGPSNVVADCRGIAVAGSNVFVGGNFTNAGGVLAYYVARWNGSNWFALGSGVGSNVVDVLYHNGLLYVCGRFTNAGGASANRIASWNGSSWSPLGTGLDFTGSALAASGNDLYACGPFTNAGGVLVNRVAKWSGGIWSALGSGLSGGTPNSIAIVGSNVYVGGTFTTAGGVSVSRIARWNGATWSAVGGGITSGAISSMTAAGTNLYVGGTMTMVGTLPINRVARWDGANWSNLGSGLGFYVFSGGSVFAMRGVGNDIYFGGPFTVAGHRLSHYFARWNDQIDFDAVPTFSNVRATSAGPFQATVTANGDSSYVIEGTANFQSWTPLLTNSASSYQFSNSILPGVPYRFYRARPE